VQMRVLLSSGTSGTGAPSSFVASPAAVGVACGVAFVVEGLVDVLLLVLASESFLQAAGMLMDFSTSVPCAGDPISLLEAV